MFKQIILSIVMAVSALAGTYSSAYKSGSFTTVSGTAVNLSGVTLDTSDVGRLIIIYTGDARLQHREIMAVSGQTVTLSHSWDSQPFIDTSADLRASDKLPSVGDQFVISYDADDLVSSDADMTASGNNSLLLGSITAQSGAYIHFKNLNVQLASADIEIGQGGGMIFGYYNPVYGADGYTKDACNITDTSTGSNGDQWAVSSSNSFGLLDMYGANIYIPGSVFWRGYQDVSNAREVQCRWIGCSAYGGLGSRTDGERSMLIVKAVGGRTTLGISNPRAAVARIELSALDCDQGAYVWLSDAGGAEGRAVFNELADVNDYVLRVVGHADGAGKVYEVIAKKSEIDLVPFFASVSGTSVATHTLRYGNLVKPRYINSDLSAVTETMKASLIDVTGAEVEAQTLTDGQFSETFARHTDIATTTGSKTLASGVLYAPYSINTITYLKSIAANAVSAEETYDPSLTMLDDPLITEADAAVTAASLTQDSTEEAYDALKWVLVDSYAGETETIVTRTADLLDARGYDVVINGTGSGLPTFDGATITINSAAFDGSIKSDGATITGTEFILGSVFDLNGDSVINITPPAGYENITVYPSLADAEAKTNELASGLTIRYLSSLYGGATLYFRAETNDGIPALGSHTIATEAGVYDVNIATTAENSALGQILALVISNDERQEDREQMLDDIKVRVDSTNNLIDK